MRHFLLLCCTFTVLFTACNDGGKRTSPKGYEYILHKEGEGNAAKPGDIVYFHYTMRTADSLIFSTREQDQNPVIQVPSSEDTTREITPIEDVLGQLRLGDSVTIPIRIDTIKDRPEEFLEIDEIFYDVVVTKIIPEAEFKAMQEKRQEDMMNRMQSAAARAETVQAQAQDIREQYLAGTLQNVQSTATGLKYYIVEEGTGPRPQNGQEVEVQYIGMLRDGNIFDQSFEQGRPIPFPLGMGRVIPGWDEGIALLKEGSKAVLFIPSELAYGEQGAGENIPPNSELVFYVELEKINTDEL